MYNSSGFVRANALAKVVQGVLRTKKAVFTIPRWPCPPAGRSVARFFGGYILVAQGKHLLAVSL